MTLKEIAEGLSEARREEILRWDDFHIGKWLFRRSGLFPARKQGRTAAGELFRAYLLENPQ